MCVCVCESKPEVGRNVIFLPTRNSLSAFVCLKSVFRLQQASEGFVCVVAWLILHLFRAQTALLSLTPTDLLNTNTHTHRVSKFAQFHMLLPVHTTCLINDLSHSLARSLTHSLTNSRSCFGATFLVSLFWDERQILMRLSCTCLVLAATNQTVTSCLSPSANSLTTSFSSCSAKREEVSPKGGLIDFIG